MLILFRLYFYSFYSLNNEKRVIIETFDKCYVKVENSPHVFYSFTNEVFKTVLIQEGIYEIIYH